MALVAGIPNVGKSTLINAIRGQLRYIHSSSILSVTFCDGGGVNMHLDRFSNNVSDHKRGGKSARDYQQKLAKVGAHPGVTRHLSAFKLGDGLYGPLYMVDTPGGCGIVVRYFLQHYML